MPEHRTKIATAAHEGSARQAESHYGDLRKGMFLKRRAEYRMQVSASAGIAIQAGTPDKLS